METHPTVSLVRHLERVLPFPAAEAFRCHIKAYYQRMPLAELITGSRTTARVLPYVKSALQELKELETGGKIPPLPWERISSIMLDCLANALAKNAHTATRQSKKATAKSGARDSNYGEAFTKLSISASRAGSCPSSSTLSPSCDNSEPVPAREDLRKLLDGSTPIYKVQGQRHVRCNDHACKFCRTMFLHLNITSCRALGHKPCHPCGWFPHVGLTLWKVLRRPHNAGEAFAVKHAELKEGEHPPLYRDQLAPPQVHTQGVKRTRSQTFNLEEPLWVDMCDGQ